MKLVILKLKSNISAAINSRSGMTLVEIIVSMALLSIVLILAANMFLTGMSILAASTKKSQKSLQAAGGIENKAGGAAIGSAVISSSTGNFTLVFGSSSYTVSGSYVTGTDSDGDVKYKSFQPTP